MKILYVESGTYVLRNEAVVDTVKDTGNVMYFICTHFGYNNKLARSPMPGFLQILRTS